MTPRASPAPLPPCPVPVPVLCRRSRTGLRSRPCSAPPHRPEPDQPASLVLSARLSVSLVVTPNKIRVLALTQCQVITEQLQRDNRGDRTQHLRDTRGQQEPVAILKRFAVLLSQEHQRHRADLQHCASK